MTENPEVSTPWVIIWCLKLTIFGKKPWNYSKTLVSRGQKLFWRVFWWTFKYKNYDLHFFWTGGRWWLLAWRHKITFLGKVIIFSPSIWNNLIKTRSFLRSLFRLLKVMTGENCDFFYEKYDAITQACRMNN